MLAVLLLAIVPLEMRLPEAGLCPDAVNDAGTVQMVYGDGRNGWYCAFGSDSRVRINSLDGSVQAAGERGPKIAVSNGVVYTAWQGDYRQGPNAWFARSIDGGKTFEPQRNLIDAKTPGLDHVAIAAQGTRVAVLWLDGRGGPDANAPVTSTLWFSLSTDSGKTFGPNTQIRAEPMPRPCACCSFVPCFQSDGKLVIDYRSGVGNVRDIWEISGDFQKWSNKRITTTGWIFEGCPMDGPRRDEAAMSYTIDGSCFVKTGESVAVLGKGKYPSVLATRAGWFACWQDGDRVRWRSQAGETGAIAVGSGRPALVAGSGGRPLVIR